MREQKSARYLYFLIKLILRKQVTVDGFPGNTTFLEEKKLHYVWKNALVPVIIDYCEDISTYKDTSIKENLI